MAISLGGQTVPAAAAQNVKQGKRGATFGMADGSEKFDLVTSGDKKVISLTWQNISASDLAAILTGYATLTSSGTYTDHNAVSYTVQQNGLESVVYDEINSASGPVYNVILTLREV